MNQKANQRKKTRVMRLTNETIRDLRVKNEFLKISLIINVDIYLSNNGLRVGKSIDFP